jgi:hypothetical protein
MKMMVDTWKNKLYFRDNLGMMQEHILVKRR